MNDIFEYEEHEESPKLSIVDLEVEYQGQLIPVSVSDDSFYHLIIVANLLRAASMEGLMLYSEPIEKGQEALRIPLSQEQCDLIKALSEERTREFLAKRTLVIIDLDGVVADSTKRFEHATVNGKIDWNVAFDPSLVHLDQPIQSVYDQYTRLQHDNYTDMVLLTSRPESMRGSTEAWLKQHDFMHCGQRLFMKPASHQFTKTVVWKSEEVCRMAAPYGKVIFIDDEQPNRDAVQRLCPDVEVRASL